MKIWLVRHGQTDLNKKKLMQGLTDEPLNQTGIDQAHMMHQLVKNVHFDAVYASPLDRAITTAMIISETDKKNVIVDRRIIEVDFGNYELQSYHRLGIPMTLYWSFPELFPAPESVETVASMVARSQSFLKELEKKEYENVLVCCHGGIIRALKGYLEDRSNGIVWRPKPKNCEICVYETIHGNHKFIQKLQAK